MKLKVFKDGEPVLREATEKVESFDMELQTLIDNMVDTMREHNGIGLAAPQVGHSKKILVCEYQTDEEDEEEGYKKFPLTILCNPKIKKASSEQCKMVEGCLSFPGMELVIKRPQKITVTGQDRYGKPIEISADNIQGRVIQHEIDHLNSTLFVDHIKEVSVVFFGTGNFGLHTLESLHRDPQYKVKAVITGSSEKLARGKKVDANNIKLLANKLKIPVIEVKTLKDDKAFKQIKSLKPDLGVVTDFGFIIPKKIFTIPKYKTLNIHPSLLPKYRGTTPIQSAILNGDHKIGVSIIKIDEGVDSGPIIAQTSIKLSGSENYQILHDYLSELGASLLLTALPYYITGDIKPVIQHEKKATYTKILKKLDGEVVPETSGVEVDRMIRAFYPWPGVYTDIKGKRIQITAAHLDKEKHLVIDRVKPAGKNEMSYDDFKNGYREELTFSE
ncbi:MAG: methionyl-tRNA formyltransferase [Patescibacteria group bacterium]